MTAAIEELTRAVEAKEQNRVLQALKAPVLELQGVDDQAAPQYVKELVHVQQALPTDGRLTRGQVSLRRLVGCQLIFLPLYQIQDAVDKGNAEAEQERQG